MKTPIVALLTTLLAAGCASSKSDSQPAASDAPFFPIMTWEHPPRANQFTDDHAGLRSVAEANFTTAAFVLPADLPRCRQLGLRAMLRSDTGRTKWGKTWRQLSDVQIEERVRDLIADTASDPTVLGYFLEDEPNVAEFPALGKATALVKKLAPGKIAYINLYPDYATIGSASMSQLGTDTYTEYLERFVAEAHPQLISYDNYRVQISLDNTDPAKSASYYHNLLEVRRVAQKHNLPFWNIGTGNQIRPFTPPPSPANLLFQAHTTLAAGGSGMTWFTYYTGSYRHGAVNKSNSRTTTWSYLRMVNDQLRTLGTYMRDLHSTGVYFTSPTPAPNLPTLPGRLIISVNSPTPVMIGEFIGPADSRYAMLVNLSLERSAKLLPKLADNTPLDQLQQISPVDARLSPLDQTDGIWLPAGQGILLKLK